MIPEIKAASIQDTFGTITPPSEMAPLGTGAQGISRLLDNIVGIFFAAAGIAFIIMFIWGAVQMILSQGDKEAVAKARAKITWAIVGIILIALSYVILYLLQSITGFKFFIK